HHPTREAWGWQHHVVGVLCCRREWCTSQNHETGKFGGFIEATSQDIKNLWAELKKHVRARRPTNLTQLHQLCQEEWAKIHPTYCGKLVEGYPKHLTQVKPF
uniref:Uncharacterized protein n=1 Tax=Oncorhynchus tshawytscha TaxID=74940 RepID=A0AAZ3SDD1_ONCTS